MKKFLFILCFLMIACTGVADAQQNINPNFLILDAVDIGSQSQLYVVNDKKRNVTCWIVEKQHYYSGPALWCMKNDIPTEK